MHVSRILTAKLGWGSGQCFCVWRYYNNKKKKKYILYILTFFTIIFLQCKKWGIWVFTKRTGADTSDPILAQPKLPRNPTMHSRGFPLTRSNKPECETQSNFLLLCFVLVFSFCFWRQLYWDLAVLSGWRAVGSGSWGSRKWCHRCATGSSHTGSPGDTSFADSRRWGRRLSKQHT